VGAAIVAAALDGEAAADTAVAAAAAATVN